MVIEVAEFPDLCIGARFLLAEVVGGKGDNDEMIGTVFFIHPLEPGVFRPLRRLCRKDLRILRDDYDSQDFQIYASYHISLVCPDGITIDNKFYW